MRSAKFKSLALEQGSEGSYCLRTKINPP